MTLGFPIDRSSTQSLSNAVKSPDLAFDDAIHELSQALAPRREVEGDRNFLTELFVACSPIAGFLPDAMLWHQAEIQYAAYASQFPNSMRRIVMHGGKPIGRVVIDWDDAATQCVDIAVMPHHCNQGIGSAMLRAWLTVSDALDKDAWLSVRTDSPAMRLYARLGFVAKPSAAPSAVAVMTRRAGGWTE